MGDAIVSQRQKDLMAGLEEAGDHFSLDGRYRYTLWKWWDRSQPRLCTVLLNPSIGHSGKFDATNTRCERRARQLGFGGIIFTNIFPIVATDPRDMLEADDPLGEEADRQIIEAARSSGMVLCGWGVHGAHRGRGQEVRRLLHKNHIPVTVLGLTKDGHPKHPLYVAYDIQPKNWEYPWEPKSERCEASQKDTPNER